MLPSATAWLSRKSRQLLGYLPSDQPASDRTVSTAPQEAAADRGQSVLRDSTSAVAGDDKALSHRGFASSDKQRLPELPGLVARAARQDPLQDDARQQAIGNVSNADRGTPDIARASQGDRNDTLQQPVITTASQRRRAADVGLGNGLQTSCSAEPESPRIPSSASSHKQDLTASAARRKPLRCLNSSGELGQLNSLAVAAPGEVIDFCEADHSPWQRVLAESPSPAAVERQQEIANSGAWVSAQRAAPGSDWVQVETQSSISSALADGQPGEGPVFVPIVMSMDPHDHATLVEQWHSRLQVQPCAHHVMIWTASASEQRGASGGITLRCHQSRNSYWCMWCRPRSVVLVTSRKCRCACGCSRTTCPAMRAATSPLSTQL